MKLENFPWHLWHFLPTVAFKNGWVRGSYSSYMLYKNYQVTLVWGKHMWFWVNITNTRNLEAQSQEVVFLILTGCNIPSLQGYPQGETSKEIPLTLGEQWYRQVRLLHLLTGWQLLFIKGQELPWWCERDITGGDWGKCCNLEKDLLF